MENFQGCPICQKAVHDEDCPARQDKGIAWEKAYAQLTEKYSSLLKKVEEMERFTRELALYVFAQWDWRYIFYGKSPRCEKCGVTSDNESFNHIIHLDGCIIGRAEQFLKEHPTKTEDEHERV